MKRILLSYLFFNLSIILCHSGVIQGHIISDNNSDKINGAACAIFANDSIVAESISGDDGRFAIETSFSGPAILIIDALDYDRYEKEIDIPKGGEYNVGECQLIHSDTLQELVVESKSVRSEKGKIIYAPTKGALAASTFAPAFLGQLGIPGLTYNRINETVAIDNSTPVILINGVKASENEIKYLKASDIANVEFSKVVPLLYYGQGNSVINIILKQRNDGGSLSLGDQTDIRLKMEDPFIGFNYHKGPSSWDINYNFSFRDNKDTYDYQYEHFLSREMDVVRESNLHSPFGYRSHRANLSYLYNPNESWVFSAKVNFSSLNSHRGASGIIEDSMLGDTGIDQYSRYMDINPNVDLYLRKSFGDKNSIQINLAGNYDNSDLNYNDREFTETYNSLIDNHILSHRYSLVSGLNYEHQFSANSILTALYQNTASRNINHYTATESSENAIVKENNNSLRLMLQQGLGPVWLNLQGGIGINHLNAQNIVQNFTNGYANLDAQWTINKNWSLSYNFSYDSPNKTVRNSIEYLTQLSPYLWMTGNINLKQQTPVSNFLRAHFSSGIWNIYLDAAHYSDANSVMWYTNYDHTVQGFVMRPVNGSESEIHTAIQGGFNGLLNMFDFFGLVRYAHWKTVAEGEKLILNGVSGMIRLTWYKGKWAVSYARNFPGKGQEGFDRSPNFESYDALSVSFKPDNHWKFDLSYCYMFRDWKHWTKTISDHYVSYNSRSIKTCSNLVWITVTYNVDFGKQFTTKGKQRTLQLQDNQKGFLQY